MPLYLLGHGEVDEYEMRADCASRRVDPELMAEFDEFAGVRVSASPWSGLPPSQFSLEDFAALDVHPIEAAPIRVSRLSLSDAIDRGSTFVNWLAGVRSLWSPTAATPWCEEAEQLVALQLYHLTAPLKPFIVGVLRELRASKAELNPVALAAGFLVLSCVDRRTLLSEFRRVNLRQTCDAGCRFGGEIVPAAARYARTAIYGTDAA